VGVLILVVVWTAAVVVVPVVVCGEGVPVIVVGVCVVV
jgi:hypothetical protein